MEKMRLSRAIHEKFRWNLKDYAEMRGLSYMSIRKGFLSKKTKEVLQKDGIDVDKIIHINCEGDEADVA